MVDSKHIIASFIVTSHGSPLETQRVVESYTSTTSAHDIPRLLRNIQEVIVEEKDSNYVPDHKWGSLEDRVNSYGSHLTDPVQLGGPRHFKVDVRISCDALNWDLDGVPNLLVRFAGNIFRTVEAEGIKWVDLSIPDDYLTAYPWAKPRYGISGVKKFLEVPSEKQKALVGATIQPNIGLTSSEFATMAAHSVNWGADLIIEDEMLGDLPISPLKDRLIQVSEKLERLGKKSIYLVNVLGWSEFILDELPSLLLELNKKNKNVLCGIMMCPIYGGFNLMKRFRQKAECPIFAHYYSISLFIRNPSFGISTKVLSTLAALSGSDFVYVGHVSGRHIAESPIVLNYVAKTLRSQNVFPAISGGINPGNVIANLRSLGQETLVQSASGIFGHPMGPKAGFESLKKMISLNNLYCHECSHTSISECTGFPEMLKNSPELQILFAGKLPAVTPEERL